MMISFNLEFLLKDIIKKYCLKKWILKKQEVEHSLKKLKSLEKEIESNLIKIKIKSKSFLVKVESLEYFQMKLNQIYISQIISQKKVVLMMKITYQILELDPLHQLLNDFHYLNKALTFSNDYTFYISGPSTTRVHFPFNNFFKQF